jgi:hypothetical protein
VSDIEQEMGEGGGAELNAIIMQAGMVDGLADAASPEAMQQAQEMQIVVSMAEQNASAVAGVLSLAIPLIAPLYPSLEGIYTPEVCERVAASLGPLLAKYGVNMEDMGGKYREEIAAAFICGPIAVATYKGIKADVEARAGAPKALVQQVTSAAPGPVPGASPGVLLRPGDYGYEEARQAGALAA